MLLASANTAHQCAQHWRSCPASSPVSRRHRRIIIARSRGGGNPLDESVLERLRAAEEEAARLREQLAKQEAGAQGESPAAAEVIDSKTRRVDGVEARETLFSASQGKSSSIAPGWLNEADVQFFLGGAPPNPELVVAAEGKGEDPEAAKIVQRRLLIGSALSAAVIGLSLIPTEALRMRPSKPLYFYIVPLLRIRDLLADDSPALIESADWAQLRFLLSRITGKPNNVHETFDNIVALLDTNQSQVQQLRTEFEEYLDNMDFNKYYNSMPGTKITGKQNQEFVSFSAQAQKAAMQRLDKILKLLPEEAVQQAVEASKIS